VMLRALVIAHDRFKLRGVHHRGSFMHHGAARIDGRIYVVGGRIYAVSGANVAGGGGPHEGVQVNEAYDLR